MGLTIYVAGPYSADTEKGRLANTQKAMDIALALIKKGHYPYIPHLSHFVDIHAKEQGIDLSWEFWMHFDFVWLEKCDALFFISESPGANMELGRMDELGRKVFYDLGEVPDEEAFIA